MPRGRRLAVTGEAAPTPPAEPPVAIAVSPRGWAEGLHRFAADHGGVRVRARVLDARQALDEPYAVLAADDLTSFLTPRLATELRRSGRRLLGVYDPVEPQGRRWLERVGADTVLPATAGPEELLAALRELAATATSTTAPAVGGAPASAPDPAPAGGASPGRGRAPADRGRVTVVGAPPGGCGATEVVLALAQALAADGGVVVVDADPASPAVAQRLGVGLHPNLRSAVDAVEHWTGEVTGTLQRPPRTRFEVLAGVRAGADLRAGEVADVVRELAVGRREVVVDLGARAEVGGDRGTGLARALLAEADRVVAVGAPTPVGLSRLLRWLAGARAVAAAPLEVAFNRVPAGAFLRSELEAELRRTWSPAGLVFLPADGRVQRAAWAGRPVPRGPFTRAVARLAAGATPASFCARGGAGGARTAGGGLMGRWRRCP